MICEKPILLNVACLSKCSQICCLMAYFEILAQLDIKVCSYHIP